MNTLTEWPDHAIHNTLVISNDAELLKHFNQFTEKWHFTYVKNCEHAFQQLEMNHFEIVVLDLDHNAPEKIAFLEHLPKINKNITRVLVGEKEDSPIILEAFNSQIIQHFICKPINEDQLKTILQKSSKAFSEKCERYAIVSQKLQPLRNKLIKHELYNMIDTSQKLKIFLEHHCYAVWDFMCLLKTLQTKLTCTSTPWYATENKAAARMINEIVVAEETDELPDKSGYISHFELYLQAMHELEADTDTCVRFTDLIKENMHWRLALKQGNIPAASKKFVEKTLTICECHPVYEVAAYFLFGRENLIPDMFREIVKTISENEHLSAEYLIYYLERHIDVDEHEHGPASIAMLNALCGNDDTKWRLVERAAIEALQARIDLWDGISLQIKQRNFGQKGMFYKVG